MAIIRNIVMRGASQRLGGVVFYTRSGETIARELAPSVSNPRTEVQMAQRVKMGNVVAFYKVNKFWMTGAFEDKLEKETDYNAFVKKNLTSSRVAFRKENVDVGASVVAPYQVSSGSLGEIECSAQTTGVRSNIYCGALIITAGTTVGQFSAAILTNNNQIVKGMQLSLVINVQRVTLNGAKPYIVARVYEVILDENSSELLSKYFPQGMLSTLDLTGKPLFYDATSVGDGAATFILSHTISGKTYVSTQSMVMYGSHTLYDYFTSDDQIARAIASYGATETNFLDSSQARSYNNVVLSNYIQALQYSSRLYTEGAEVQINNSSDLAFLYYFAQSVPEDAVLSISVNGEEISTTGWQIAWGSGRLRVSLNKPAGFVFSNGDEVNFAITYDEETIDFTFTAVVG